MADNEVQIDSLSVAIEHSASTASKDLSSLASSLKKLQTSVSALNMWDAVRQFDALGAAAGSLTYFSTALDSLRNAKISSSIGRQLKEIGDAANNLETLDTAALDKVKALGESLKPLGELGRAQLTSFINQLAKLPQLAANLDTVDMERFAATVERLTEAMAPLATEMDKIARGFAAFPQRIRTFIKNNEAAAYSVKMPKKEMDRWQGTLGKVLGRLEKIENKPSLFKKLISISVLKQAGQFLKSDLESANEYIEALNLFYVSMGGYAEKAQQYAEIVGDSYGIDPGEFMRMQATFMDVSKSFGTASGTAYTMSKALAQLTYDISSLYNLKIDEALNKTRSALVGEIEPIRALGKDLSVANLKLLATELGVTANVDAMNQSEKAMLRTISLLRQSKSAMGDMARTLEQPANQFRILKAQLTLLSRAIGDLFLPLMQKVLPYMTAFIKVSQRIVMAFAELAGFKLPKFDYADTIVEGNKDIAGSADSAAKSMKKLYQLSFDELNILGSQNTGSSGSGASAADIAKLEAELNRLAEKENELFSKNLGETTDKIAAQIENWITKGKGVEEWAAGVWDNFKGIKDAAVAVADSLGLWKIPAAIADLTKSLGLDVGAVDFNFGSSKQGKVTGGGTLKNLLGSGLGLALGIGALAIASTGAGGGLLAKGLGIALGIGAIDMLYDNVTSGKNDTSTGNGLLKTVTNALSLGLLGASLSLLGGKGLKYSVAVAFGISSAMLLFDGITGIVDTDPDNDLASVVKLGIGSALGGVGLMWAGGMGRLKYTMSMALGITALTLDFSAVQLLNDSNPGNDLLGKVLDGLSLALFSGAAAKSGAGAIAGGIFKFLGVGAGAATAGGAILVGATLKVIFDLIFDFENTKNSILDVTGLGDVIYSDSHALDVAKKQIEANKTAAEALNQTNALKQAQQDSLNDLAQLSDQLQKNSLDSLAAMSKNITVGSDTAIANLSKIGNEVNKVAESDIYKPIYDKTDKLGTDLNTKGKSAGENVAKGFVAGVDYNADYVAKGMIGMANKAMVQFTDSLGIHSPSTVFEGYGINVDVGFANGVTLGLPNVKDAFGNVWTSIRVDFSAFANSLLASARTFIRQLNQVLSSASFSSGGTAQSLIGKTPRMVPAFAAGGFPEDGMFYANSGELVGRFANGRTAVANNAQIIEGIENAVYRAMAAAQRGSGRGGKIELVLDKQVVGRVFGDAIDSEKRRSGANTKITFTNGGTR